MTTEFDKQIAELWSTTCPECGMPAYLGMNQFTCINTPARCKNGNAKERDKYAKLLEKKLKYLVEASEDLDDDEKTDPIGFRLDGYYVYWQHS